LADGNREHVTLSKRNPHDYRTNGVAVSGR
jgi:hypothetical protein